MEFIVNSENLNKLIQANVQSQYKQEKIYGPHWEMLYKTNFAIPQEFKANNTATYKWILEIG